MARLWRLRLAGNVERIVGHFTFAGLARRDSDSEKVAEVGRRQERWRHRQLEGGTPARPREVLEEVVGEKVEPERFEDVPIDMVRGEWRVASSGGWERSESIATLEGRSLVHALRYDLRDSHAVGRRILLLTDSMTATLALGKGRSSAPGMMRVARQFAAWCLAGGVVASVRWLPSERNHADAPSRQRMPIGVRLHFDGRDHHRADGQPAAWPVHAGRGSDRAADGRLAARELAELAAREGASARWVGYRRPWRQENTGDNFAFRQRLHSLDPAPYYGYDKLGELCAVAVAYVDDPPLGISPKCPALCYSFHELLPWGDWGGLLFTFCVKQAWRDDEGVLHLRQTECANAIEVIALIKERNTELSSDATAAEFSDNRSALGALGRLSSQTRPDLAAGVAMGQPTIQDLLETNRLIKLARKHADVTFFAGAKFLRGDRARAGIVDWRSRALERVCRSTLAAKTMSAVGAPGCAQIARRVCASLEMSDAHPEDIPPSLLPLAQVTHCASLCDTMQKYRYSKPPPERRLLLDLINFKESLEEEVSNEFAADDQRSQLPLFWVPTGQQLGDQFTKRSDGSAIRALLRQTRLALQHQEPTDRAGEHEAKKKKTRDRVCGGWIGFFRLLDTDGNDQVDIEEFAQTRMRLEGGAEPLQPQRTLNNLNLAACLAALSQALPDRSAAAARRTLVPAGQADRADDGGFIAFSLLRPIGPTATASDAEGGTVSELYSEGRWQSWSRRPDCSRLPEARLPEDVRLTEVGAPLALEPCMLACECAAACLGVQFGVAHQRCQ
ncbi:unnamed protein product, partial [Prorocentrum cordatum]